MTDELVKSSFEYCENIAREHYENFPVASKFLPADKRKYIYAIYAFARQADDYADEPNYGNGEKRIQLLDEWNDKLRKAYERIANEPIFIALGETVRDCGIPIEPLENLLKAFRQDVNKNRYENFGEVLAYCVNSANPVGRLVLYVFGSHDDTMFNYSDRICTALQLTNFWQDIKIDLAKNRIYLPKEDMTKYGYSEAELFDYRYNDEFIELMRFQVNRTEQLFNEGEELVRLMAKDDVLKGLTSELNLILSGGRMILKKIKGVGYDVFNKRPVITGIDKLKLFSKYKFL